MVEDKSMEANNDQPNGLTIDFRRKVFNMFVKKVIELGNNPTDPSYNVRLRNQSLNIEAGIFKKATNRVRVFLLIDGNPLRSNVIQTPVVHANQSAQPIYNASSSLLSFPSTSHPIQASQMMSMPAAVPTMPQRNTPMQSTGLHQFQQGGAFERQNPLISSMVMPLEQGTRFHNTTGVQKSYMPSSPAGVQNFDVFQSQTSPAQTPSFVIETSFSFILDSTASFLDAGAVNAADWKLLLMEYRQAKMEYLPELISMLKKAKEDCAKVQGVIQHEKAKYLKNCELMIRFLQYSESDLTCFPKDRICKNLSTITHFFNCMKNQAPKAVSNERISVNQLQNTPLVQHGALASKNVFPQSPFDAPISYGLIAPKQIDMQAVLNNGSRGTKEQNSPLNLKRNSEPMQPSDMDRPLKKQQLRKPKEKDIMDSMFMPSTKPKRGRPKSTKQPPLQKKNTSCVSDPRAMSQNVASMAAADSAPTPATPSSVPKDTEVQVKFASIVTSSGTITSLPVYSATTPITPSSAPKEIRELAQSVSPNEIGAIAAARDAEVQDKSASLVTYGTITTPLPSDGAAESSQTPQSAMLPIDRLVRAVQRVSKDTLKRAVNDMYSAINDMDRLPKNASFGADESNPFMDDYEEYDPIMGYLIEK
uniref:Uncharacterized protein n=1 Tax=Chenopodium quinoa TaxID=63459 RepID=A0A803LZY9_CHEQI